MNFIRIRNRFKKLNIFLSSILILFLFFLSYYFYSSQRYQKLMYVRAILGRDLLVPYWIANSLKIGDIDQSSFGQINARVVNMQIYDSFSLNKTAILLLQARLIKDRSGVLLFKSRPISVGEFVNLRFPQVNQTAMVTYIGDELPRYDQTKFIIKIKKRGDLPESVTGINVGSTIVDNKGDVLAKIIEKKVSPSEILVDIPTDRIISSFDTRRVDAEFTIDILTNKIKDDFYFQETQKIKNFEKINMHFKDVSLFDFRIISIERSKIEKIINN